MSPPLAEWAWAFALTLVIEVPLYMALPMPFSWRRRLLLAVGLNLATHPFLWYGFPRFQPYGLWLGVAELWVALTEGLLLSAMWRPRWWAPLASAAAINAVSAVLGLLLTG